MMFFNTSNKYKRLIEFIIDYNKEFISNKDKKDNNIVKVHIMIASLNNGLLLMNKIAIFCQNTNLSNYYYPNFSAGSFDLENNKSYNFMLYNFKEKKKKEFELYFSNETWILFDMTTNPYSVEISECSIGFL